MDLPRVSDYTNVYGLTFEASDDETVCNRCGFTVDDPDSHDIENCDETKRAHYEH